MAKWIVVKWMKEGRKQVVRWIKDGKWTSGEVEMLGAGQRLQVRGSTFEELFTKH